MIRYSFWVLFLFIVINPIFSLQMVSDIAPDQQPSEFFMLMDPTSGKRHFPKVFTDELIFQSKKGPELIKVSFSFHPNEKPSTQLLSLTHMDSIDEFSLTLRERVIKEILPHDYEPQKSDQEKITSQIIEEMKPYYKLVEATQKDLDSSYIKNLNTVLQEKRKYLEAYKQWEKKLNDGLLKLEKPVIVEFLLGEISDLNKAIEAKKKIEKETKKEEDTANKKRKKEFSQQDYNHKVETIAGFLRLTIEPFKIIDSEIREYTFFENFNEFFENLESMLENKTKERQRVYAEKLDHKIMNGMIS